MLGHGPLSSLHWSSSGSSPGLIRMANQAGATPVCPGSGMRSPAQRHGSRSSAVAATGAVGAGAALPFAVGEGVAFPEWGSGVWLDTGNCPGRGVGCSVGVRVASRAVERLDCEGSAVAESVRVVLSVDPLADEAASGARAESDLVGAAAGSSQAIRRAATAPTNSHVEILDTTMHASKDVGYRGALPY